MPVLLYMFQTLVYFWILSSVYKYLLSAQPQWRQHSMLNIFSGCTFRESSSFTRGVGMWVELQIFVCSTDFLLSRSSPLPPPGKKAIKGTPTGRRHCQDGEQLRFSKAMTGWVKERNGWMKVELFDLYENMSAWVFGQHQPDRTMIKDWLFSPPAYNLQLINRCVSPTNPNILIHIVTWKEEVKNKTSIWLIRSLTPLILRDVNRDAAALIR